MLGKEIFQTRTHGYLLASVTLTVGPFKGNVCLNNRIQRYPSSRRQPISRAFSLPPTQNRRKNNIPEYLGYTNLGLAASRNTEISSYHSLCLFNNRLHWMYVVKTKKKLKRETQNCSQRGDGTFGVSLDVWHDSWTSCWHDFHFAWSLKALIFETKDGGTDWECWKEVSFTHTEKVDLVLNTPTWYEIRCCSFVGL